MEPISIMGAQRASAGSAPGQSRLPAGVHGGQDGPAVLNGASKRSTYVHRQDCELSGSNGLGATAGFQYCCFRGCNPGGFSGFGFHRKSLVIVPKYSGGHEYYSVLVARRCFFWRTASLPSTRHCARIAGAGRRSIMTFTHAGLPDAAARDSAAGRSPGRVTSSPCAPSAAAARS